jgi:hypothetical protein
VGGWAFQSRSVEYATAPRRAQRGKALVSVMYAYDAYLLTRALTHQAPLLTLDADLGRTAVASGVTLVEIGA